MSYFRMILIYNFYLKYIEGLQVGKSFKMILLVLFVGALVVAIILTFMSLGALNLVPWLLVAMLVAVPLLFNLSEKKIFAVWKDEYSVGVKSLDDDHRKLLDLINKLQTAVHYQTGDAFEKEALDEVIAYTKYHFEREEKLMEEAGYSDLDEHKKTHQSMIAKVDDFVKDYESKGHEVLEEVASYLKDWLIGHINGTDQEYSALLKEKGVA